MLACKATLLGAALGHGQQVCYYTWATLMRGVHAIDVLQRARRQAPMQIAAQSHARETSRQTLECLG
ncbi:MAG: hypothetical protein U0V87_14175 [Acidobacteriota bacterium]